MRTAHQVDAKAQLVVRALRGRRVPSGEQDVPVDTLGLGFSTGAGAAAATAPSQGGCCLVLGW